MVPHGIAYFPIHIYISNQEPVSISLKRAKYLSRFIIGFLLSLNLLTIAWLAVGCAKRNFVLKQCDNDSWVYLAIRSHDVNSKRELVILALYFILNLCGTGRGDISAHTLHEAIVVTLSVFVLSFHLTFLQAHVFALVYKLTMRNRIYLQNKEETNKVLNK